METSLSPLKRNIVVFSLLVLDFLILVSPYCIWGYTAPVGWDTPWYIYNMRLVAEQGVYVLFEKTPGINFYSVFGYVVSSVFHISFVDTEKFLPIILATCFALVNFQIVKKLSKSWRLSVYAMAFTIIDINILRLTTDLHRNLLSFLLIEIALFLLLPDFLERTAPKKIGVFILLMTMAGISHLETFALSILVLLILVVFYSMERSLRKASVLLFCIVVPCALVIALEYPYLLDYLKGHQFLDTSVNFSFQKFVAAPWDYGIYLGIGLLPFYIVGLRNSLTTYKKNPKNGFLIIPLWNIVLIAGSFLPLLTIKIRGARFLYLATVPPLATIGCARLCNKKGLKFKIVTFIIVFVLAVISRAYYLSTSYAPWISERNYKQLTWIDSDNNDKQYIFVLYFNKTSYTSGMAEIDRHWVWALSGTNGIVYFGTAENLLKKQPTDSSDPYINATSYFFWNEIKNLTLNDVRIYIIKEWYETSINSGDFTLEHEGVYRMEIP